MIPITASGDWYGREREREGGEILKNPLIKYHDILFVTVTFTKHKQSEICHPNFLLIMMNIRELSLEFSLFAMMTQGYPI